VQQSFRRQDRRHLCENFPSQSLSPDGQPASLVVGEPQAPFPELLPKHAVLLVQIFDPLQLALIHQQRSGQTEMDPERSASRRFIIGTSEIPVQKRIFSTIQFSVHTRVWGGAAFNPS